MLLYVLMFLVLGSQMHRNGVYNKTKGGKMKQKVHFLWLCVRNLASPMT